MCTCPAPPKMCSPSHSVVRTLPRFPFLSLPPLPMYFLPKITFFLFQLLLLFEFLYFEFCFYFFFSNFVSKTCSCMFINFVDRFGSSNFVKKIGLQILFLIFLAEFVFPKICTWFCLHKFI